MKFIYKMLALLYAVTLILSAVQAVGYSGAGSDNGSTTGLLFVQSSNRFGQEEHWWMRWNGDEDRNGIEDTIDAMLKDSGLDPEKTVDILVDYDHLPGTDDVSVLTGSGFDVTYVSKYINTVAISAAPLPAISGLRNLPGVVEIEQQAEYKPLLDISVPAMKVRESSTYANVAWDFGVTGDGINIAIIDTGVDDVHDSLEGKFITGADFSGGIVSLKNPDDKEGHGTHCAGIAMGTGGSGGKYIGVAPDAGLIDVKVFNDWTPTTSSSAVMSGIEWCMDNKDTYDIDVLSLSIGEVIVGNDDGLSAEAQLVDRASESGLVVVVAAGNEGPNNNGFSSLAAAETAITVGSIYDGDTVDRSDDSISDFSNRGPRADDGDNDRIDEFKPDVCAPGQDIWSAMHANSVIVKASGYTEKSGTSMAAPHIAGLAALLLEANPTLSPEEVKNIIRETATSVGKPYNEQVSDKYNRDYGWGIADGYESVKRASGDFMRAEITSFADNAIIGGITEIKGIASNDKGAIVEVELSFDSGKTWVQASGTYNWNYTWDSTSVQNGVITIFVRTSNGTAYSDEFQFVVDILNIRANFSYPYPDSKLKGKVRIEGTVSPKHNVELVEIRIDEDAWVIGVDRTGEGAWTTWYYDWSTDSVKDGWHTISARTLINGIFSKPTTIRVKVDNGGDSTPGFEALGSIFAIAAVAVIIIFKRRAPGS